MAPGMAQHAKKRPVLMGNGETRPRSSNPDRPHTRRSRHHGVTVPRQRRLPYRGDGRAVDLLDRAQPGPGRGARVPGGRRPRRVGRRRGPLRGALRQLHERLLPVLDAAPAGGPRLLIEPTAGGGKSLAATVEDLGPYLAALEQHPLVGVCFDTCHAWAAGHDLSVPGGMAATLDVLEATVGPGRLGLVHANDSLDECGSKRDRHTTIGAGSIGAPPFAELLAHRSMSGVPVVVETPSELDGVVTAGHARDISLLCSLRDGMALESPAA